MLLVPGSARVGGIRNATILSPPIAGIQRNRRGRQAGAIARSQRRGQNAVVSTPRIQLKPKKDYGIAAGQVWVFKNDVDRVDGELVNGEPADVHDMDGKFLGRGLVSTESNLLFRVFLRQPAPLDNRFFRKRLSEAVDLRRRAGLPG